jgi:hypothetical protein
MKTSKKYLDLMHGFDIDDKKQIFNILSYYMSTNTSQLFCSPYLWIGEVIYN